MVKGDVDEKYHSESGKVSASRSSTELKHEHTASLVTIDFLLLERKLTNAKTWNKIEMIIENDNTL